MCRSVVPILFGLFLRVPSLHALVFIRKTLLWLVSVVYFLEIVREVGGEANGKMHGL